MMLETIQSPADLKRLSVAELESLASEIRQEIIETTLKNGGHLASNLGAVELTLALHYVFDTPVDKLVFDVGHQCYTHKLITGRYSSFSALRTQDGISGFPSHAESPFDTFDAGHASAAISQALGLAHARD
ncbi:MAG: 1-deoxy-D-xylulose-5-phosphate synthase, partial [Clostridia bacterium]|nr:1-deoxy-D-xylulose-5-phosphate synthase [Clostridia bacterium]